jgi:predicted GIY-YIG superfamily endonuclease
MNYVQNEWRRILRKCDRHGIQKAKMFFQSKLRKNDYPEKLVKRWTSNVSRDILHRNNSNGNNDKSFYLSIPFVNDGINKKIMRSLQPLGLKIRLSHKNYKLKSWLKAINNQPKLSCSLANCKLKDKNCLKSMVVYKCTCKCGANYIGSTERHLHVRIKEHFSLHNSAIYQHRLDCDNEWFTQILTHGNDLTDLRLKEAILIKKQRPSLNRKEEYVHFNLVV